MRPIGRETGDQHHGGPGREPGLAGHLPYFRQSVVRIQTHTTTALLLMCCGCRGWKYTMLLDVGRVEEKGSARLRPIACHSHHQRRSHSCSYAVVACSQLCFFDESKPQPLLGDERTGADW